MIRYTQKRIVYLFLLLVTIFGPIYYSYTRMVPRNIYNPYYHVYTYTRI